MLVTLRGKEALVITSSAAGFKALNSTLMLSDKAGSLLRMNRLVFSSTLQQLNKSWWLAKREVKQ